MHIERWRGPQQVDLEQPLTTAEWNIWYKMVSRTCREAL